MGVEERIWRTPSKSYHRPFSQHLGLKYDQPSRLFRRVLSDFGADEPFARAAAKVREHYGFEYHASGLRKATLDSAEQAAVQLREQSSEDYRRLPRTHERTVIAEADGSMICTLAAGAKAGTRPRKWEEIRLAAAQLQGDQRIVYATSFESVDDLGRRWGHSAKEVGRNLHSPIHCVGDGAEWIARQSRAVFGSQASYLCDFYHVSEYLAAAASTCRPHAPRRWRRTQQKRLRRGAHHLVSKELAGQLEAAKIPDEDAPVRVGHRYLSNRLEHLDYPSAKAAGLPIGSGLIESGNKHVLQARLKLAGCAWDRDNAQRMAQLRVLRANGHWNQLWN